MSRKDFDSFVQRKNKEQAARSFDDGQQLQEWLDYLDLLYEISKNYLGKYIDNGSVKIDHKPTTINEEFSGPYTVLEMIVHIGPSTVEFRPLGTMLIGSKGRVDVEGPGGTARLSLVNEKVERARDLINVSLIMADHMRAEGWKTSEKEHAPIKWQWKIMTAPPEMNFIPLTEENFLDMLMGVADA